MKALKISLVIIAIAAISFSVWRWIIFTPQIGDPPKAVNEFTRRIEKEIDSLKTLPDSKFCDAFYKEVTYHIDTYCEEGRLGETPADSSGNKQNKEYFIKNLYSAYVEKFIPQAFYVLNRSEWKIDDLNFIRSEYQTLRKSKLLEKDSPVDKDFAKIQSVFSKYDEIVAYISACKNFSHPVSGLDNRFPTSDMQNKISQAVTYINNNLGNAYVNHCTRLRDGLKEIPQVLFSAHVKYLDDKIARYSNRYSSCTSQSDYANTLYKPLKSEIDALDNDIYNVANFDSEYKKLSDKWKTDSQEAYKYFSNK
jgi:uncharacterized protein YoxC